MDVDMNELEKLAKAANNILPEPWWAEEFGPNRWYVRAADSDHMPWFIAEVKSHISSDETGAVHAAFIAAANPQAVLALIQMVRSAYSRALRDVREAMRVAQAEGRAPACGCDSHGFEPGCMVHDPTAVPLGREG